MSANDTSRRGPVRSKDAPAPATREPAAQPPAETAPAKQETIDGYEQRSAEPERVAMPDKPAEVVFVMCKLPNGIILHLSEKVDAFESIIGGGQRPFQIYRRIPGSDQKIAGTGHKWGEAPKILEGGYAYTKVPKDWWDRWFEQNKDTDLVRSEIIKVAKSFSVARDISASQGPYVQSGMDPIDPKNPGNGIEMAEEMKKRELTASLKAGSA